MIKTRKYVTILYHAIESTLTKFVHGRLSLIPSNIQQLFCILIGCIPDFLWHGINLVVYENITKAKYAVQSYLKIQLQTVIIAKTEITIITKTTVYKI